MQELGKSEMSSDMQALLHERGLLQIVRHGIWIPRSSDMSLIQGILAHEYMHAGCRP